MKYSSDSRENEQDSHERQSGVYEPTPRDIRRECERIQATWSPRERSKRSVIKKPKYIVPTIYLKHLADALNENESSNFYFNNSSEY